MRWAIEMYRISVLQPNWGKRFAFNVWVSVQCAIDGPHGQRCTHFLCWNHIEENVYCEFPAKEKMLVKNIIGLPGYSSFNRLLQFVTGTNLYTYQLRKSEGFLNTERNWKRTSGGKTQTTHYSDWNSTQKSYWQPKVNPSSWFNVIPLTKWITPSKITLNSSIPLYTYISSAKCPVGTFSFSRRV